MEEEKSLLKEKIKSLPIANENQFQNEDLISLQTVIELLN
jgi:hypothetical protein